MEAFDVFIEERLRGVPEDPEQLQKIYKLCISEIRDQSKMRGGSLLRPDSELEKSVNYFSQLKASIKSAAADALNASGAKRSLFASQLPSEAAILEDLAAEDQDDIEFKEEDLKNPYSPDVIDPTHIRLEPPPHVGAGTPGLGSPPQQHSHIGPKNLDEDSFNSELLVLSRHTLSRFSTAKGGKALTGMEVGGGVLGDDEEGGEGLQLLQGALRDGYESAYARF